MRGLVWVCFVACGDNLPPAVPDSGHEPDAPHIDAAPGLAILQLSPLVQDYGPVDLGCPAVTHDFTVTNAGASSTGLIAAALMGSASSAFVRTIDGCTGMTLVASASCSITVATDQLPNGESSAALVVSDGGSSVSAVLDVTGLSAGTYMITPSSVAFGAIAIGATSPPTTLTMRNVGGCAGAGPMTVTLGGNDPDVFMLANDTCAGVVLAAGEHCSVDAAYVPTASGARSAVVTISSNVFDVTVTLSGSTP